jgi:hypothetical protein
MNKQASFDIYVEYGQFFVWPGFLDEYPAGVDPTWSDEEYAQGFTWDSRLITFPNIFCNVECYKAHVEIWEADEVSLLPDTIRAIVLPLTIMEGGLVVSECMVAFSPGNYALVMEIKPRDDDEYLSSQKYLEDMEGSRIQAGQTHGLFSAI